MGFWATLLGATPEHIAGIEREMAATQAHMDQVRAAQRRIDEAVAIDEVLSGRVTTAAAQAQHTRSLEQVADAVMSGHVAPDIRQLPAVTGARRLIASTIDQLGMTVSSGVVPQWLQDPRLVDGDDAPPLDRGDVVQHTVDAMLLHGRAFWLVKWTSGDRYDPTWVIAPLHPGIVSVQHPQYGFAKRAFTISGRSAPTPEVPARAVDRRQGVEYLLHIPYVVTVDHPEGTTPLRESERMLRGLLDTELHTAELFASGTHVGGILSTEFDITTEQAKAWQDAWIVARQTGRIPVLGNGLTYRNDFPNARDLQMVEARSFNQSVVWALLGIPMAYMGSSLMGGQSSLSYANAQDNRRQFADNCLRAFTTQIEDAVSRLLPLGQRAKFDYTEWEGRADDGAQNAAPVSIPPA